MVDLPKRKVGIVACSGEELPEGTVTRLAALQVLERLRPAETVTICLPLFLAGGEGERAFARYYPTIAVDGCDRRCAAQATERYSGKPAAGLVVSALAAEAGLPQAQGRRRLDPAGLAAVELVAARLTEMVDELLGKKWDRRSGSFTAGPQPQPVSGAVETCACGSGIPVQRVAIGGQMVVMVGLPVILQQFAQSGKAPGEAVTQEIMETVKIYNPVPPDEDEVYRAALDTVYRAYWQAGRDAV